MERLRREEEEEEEKEANVYGYAWRRRRMCTGTLSANGETNSSTIQNMTTLSTSSVRPHLARRRPSPMAGSSTRSKNPCADELSHPSDMDSISLSLYRYGNGFCRYATSVSVSNTEHPR